MSLLPDSASFHERVQALFVTFRGNGVSLSAKDFELVDAWAAAEVPFEVVARGIRKAAEHALWDAAEGEGALRSLRACRKYVEAEIQKYVKRAAGKTETTANTEVPFHLARHQKLLSAIRKVTAPNVPSWLSKLEKPTDLHDADRQESLALLLLLRGLSWEKRKALLDHARSLTSATLSSAARREALRFHRTALTHQAWALPSLW